MARIHHVAEDQSKEYINIDITEPDLDFVAAKQVAKDKAFEKCDHPMILSWKNGKTGESHPDYECGVNERPFWMRYAEGRGANLTIDINHGEYVFMVLKL
ncbi:MAG: AF1514 family protein [Desulfobacter sp.]